MIKPSDVALFAAHARNYADVDTSCPHCTDDYLLRYWEENKSAYLYKLLGNQLILSKEMVYNRPEDELEYDMCNFFRKWEDFCYRLKSNLRDATNPVWHTWLHPEVQTNDAAYFYNMLDNSLCVSGLLDGRICDTSEGLGKACTVTINGKKITIAPGQKLMKAIGKLCAAFDCSEEFERFRIEHSQILNQKQLRGTLNLSIHPLDYATASDNNNGWDSCMSWMNEGCYRMGTIEMMNSPMVICAYLSGKNEMEIGDCSTYANWNSKKWRAWIIVTEKIVLINRQYPFNNDTICLTLLEWVRELAKANLNWEYDIPTANIQHNHKYGFCYRTGMMYNDIHNGSEFPGMVKMGLQPMMHTEYINFSGPAICMWCGEGIDSENGNAGSLTCGYCRGDIMCARCGRPLCEDDVLYGPDDQPYCDGCYDHEFTACDECEDVIEVSDSRYIEMTLDENTIRKELNKLPEDSEFRKWHDQYCRWGVNTRFNTNLCCDCLRRVLGDNFDDRLVERVILAYPNYRRFYNNSSLDYVKVDCTINPNEIDFETANRLFQFYNHGEDTDGSFRKVWEAAWREHIRLFNLYNPDFD